MHNEMKGKGKEKLENYKNKENQLIFQEGKSSMKKMQSKALYGREMAEDKENKQ